MLTKCKVRIKWYTKQCYGYGLCEHTSREFTFCEHEEMTRSQRPLRKFSVSWNLSFTFNTLFAPRHLQNRTTGAKLGKQQLEPIMPCLISRYVWFKITSLSFTRVSGLTLNVIWSFLRPCLQASRFPLKRVKDRPYYLGRNFGRSVSINANKTSKHFSRKIHGTHMFPQCFPVYHAGNIVSTVSFSKMEICLRYTTENFSKNPSMRAVAQILRARASELSPNFCEQFEQTPNFARTFKLNGTIRYP